MRIAVTAFEHGWLLAQAASISQAFRRVGEGTRIEWGCRVESVPEDARAAAAELRAYVVGAWPRYLGERYRREVTMSSATLMPMAAFPEDDSTVIVTTEDVEFLMLRASMVAHLGLRPTGWWPVPFLSPIPDEFADWRTDR